MQVIILLIIIMNINYYIVIIIRVVVIDVFCVNTFDNWVIAMDANNPFLFQYKILIPLLSKDEWLVNSK